MKKLAIVVTHPIQYYVPVFKLLAAHCKLRVFYTRGSDGPEAKVDIGFNKQIAWDIPLFDGYEFEFLTNKAKDQGSHHFMGINNPEIIQKINNFNPDAILVYGWAYQSHLKVLRYFKGKIPVWFRGDSHLLDPKPLWKKLLRKTLLTWVYSHIDQVFYVGKANKAYFKAFGLRDQQLVFAPHAVDNDRFSEDRPDEVKLLRQELELTDQDILILFAGKLERKKDPLILLEAFRKLNHPQAHLLFVGNGELEELLKEKANGYNNPPPAPSKGGLDLSIRKKIHFMDFQNQTQMPVIYQACDLFCLPSKGPNETWGLAVNEAMAAGKAVIASDQVGCSGDLIQPANGYIFKSNDVDSLEAGLENLLTRNLNEMGISSSYLISEWNFEKQTTAILDTLYGKKN